MLIKNPLTTYLYDHGYNGIENIYEYWLGNKVDIIKSYSRVYPERNISKDLESFEFKIRWACPFGLFIRLAVERLIRISKNTELKLDDIRIRYDGKQASIKDFADFSLGKNKEHHLTDLRGASIVSKTFENVTIKNVDFSHGALDSCEFISVKFEGCRFDKTSFTHCRLIDCSFSKDCYFDNNDFTGAMIDSEFNCSIIDPIIGYMGTLALMALKRNIDNSYLDYTVIKNDSFAYNCDDTEVKKYADDIRQRIYA